MTAIEMDEHYCRELERHLDVRAICSDAPASALEAPSRRLTASRCGTRSSTCRASPMFWTAPCGGWCPGAFSPSPPPSPDALQFRVLGRTWAHLDAPRHLQLLPEPAVRRRLEGLGMEHLLTITDDPIGLACNRLGWDYAARLHPARYRAHAVTNAVTASTGVALDEAAAAARTARAGGLDLHVPLPAGLRAAVSLPGELCAVHLVRVGEPVGFAAPLPGVLCGALRRSDHRLVLLYKGFERRRAGACAFRAAAADVTTRSCTSATPASI